MKKVIGGWILIGFGALILFGTIVNATQKAVNGVNIVGSLFFGVVSVMLGGFLIRNHLLEKKKITQAQHHALYTQQEKEIIRLAQKTGGQLTIPDIVGGTSLSTVEADAIMREMTTKGYVNMNVTDAGVIVYEFYEIAHRPKLED